MRDKQQTHQLKDIAIEAQTDLRFREIIKTVKDIQRLRQTERQTQALSGLPVALIMEPLRQPKDPCASSPLCFRTAMNRDVTTGPLARPFACLLSPLPQSLCSLTHSKARGKI